MILIRYCWIKDWWRGKWEEVKRRDLSGKKGDGKKLNCMCLLYVRMDRLDGGSKDREKDFY